MKFVVLAPDLILAGLFDPTARQVLNAWRDGQIAPVLNRELILAYLRTLRKAGIPAELLKHWATWFNHSQNGPIIAESEPAPTLKSITLCETLALAKSNCEVICFRLPKLAGTNPYWITAADLVKTL